MNIGILSDGSWAVDGTPIYVPSPGTKIDHESIQSADTGRTEDGYMHIDWIRRDMVKVSMNWKYLTGNELSDLVSLMQGKEFTLTYFDMGHKHTAKVYCSKVSATKEADELYVPDGGLYSSVSANCIEL